MLPFPFEEILDWHKKHGRHSLPWREKQTPYRVWISEIFLQQTQVSRVEKYFSRVLADFPTIYDFARLSYEDFFSYYEGLGYYSRARNMLKTAQIIVDDFDGIFPDSFQELINLPWIGPYTAQAILAFGYEKSILAFDVNVKKIFSRFYLGSRFEKLSKNQEETIQKQFEKSGISGREMNAALMDFANLVDKNDIKIIDWEKYLLKDSKFFTEKWAWEIRFSAQKTKYNRKIADILVFLHENHTNYFSAHPDRFEPFRLSPTTTDHRHAVKQYFQDIFQLSVSVRPPFLKKVHDGKTYFCYHVQIQKWIHDFGIFSSEEYKEYVRDFFKE